MNLLNLFASRAKNVNEELKKYDIVRKGRVIEAAEKGDFYKVLSEEIAKMHAEYLSQSQQSHWHAGAAFALLDLTNRLSAIKNSKDRILSEDEKRRQLPDNELEFVEPRSEPHTI